jgi:hypothetical protein
MLFVSRCGCQSWYAAVLVVLAQISQLTVLAFCTSACNEGGGRGGGRRDVAHKDNGHCFNARILFSYISNSLYKADNGKSLEPFIQ